MSEVKLICWDCGEIITAPLIKVMIEVLDVPEEYERSPCCKAGFSDVETYGKGCIDGGCNDSNEH